MIENDFKYEPILLRSPDGSLMHAFQIFDLPTGEKGEIARFLEKPVTPPSGTVKTLNENL